MAPTISLSMIVKNVDKIIIPCLTTVAPYVDEIVIVDTGSSDRTKEQILKIAPQSQIFDYTAEEFPQSFLLDEQASFDREMPGPWTGKTFLSDFAAARQFSLARCTGDYVLWLDSDDVLEDGKNLRFLVDQMIADNCETAMLTYKYAWHNGRNTGIMRRDRLFKRNDRTGWICPVHEVLHPSYLRKDYDICSVIQAFGNHPSKALGAKVNLRNLKILRHWLQTTRPQDLDIRLLYYLADEEQFLFPDEAIEHFEMCYRLSSWDAQSAKARLGAGRLHEKKAFAPETPADLKSRELAMAMQEYKKAMTTASFDPDSYFAAAALASRMGFHQQCVDLTERGIKVVLQRSDRDHLPCNVSDRTWRPMIPYAKSLFAMGCFSKSMAACNEGLIGDLTNQELIALREVCAKNLGFVLVP